MSISSNIKAVCTALNARRQGDVVEVPDDIGGLASEVAEVARMCGIPNSEVHLETMGTRMMYRRPSSDMFADLAPSYMKQKQHQHWYHIGQNFQHAASWVPRQQASSGDGQLSPPQAHLHLQLQQQLMAEIGGNAPHDLDNSDGSGSLQTENSGNSSSSRMMQDYSSTSTPTSMAAAESSTSQFV